MTDAAKEPWVLAPRTQFEALMRMLVDSGDMTPMAVRQFDNVMVQRAVWR